MAFGLFNKKQPPKPEKAAVKAVKAPAKKTAAAQPAAPQPVVEEEGFTLDFTSYGIQAEEKAAAPAAPAEKAIPLPNIGLDFGSLVAGGPASQPPAEETAPKAPVTPPAVAPIAEAQPASTADSIGLDFSAFVEKAEAMVDNKTPAPAPKAQPTPPPAPPAAKAAPATPAPAKAPAAPAPSSPAPTASPAPAKAVASGAAAPVPASVPAPAKAPAPAAQAPAPKTAAAPAAQTPAAKPPASAAQAQAPVAKTAPPPAPANATPAPKAAAPAAPQPVAKAPAPTAKPAAPKAAPQAAPNKPKPVEPQDLGLEYVPYDIAEAFASPAASKAGPVKAKAPSKTGPKSVAKAPAPAQADESAPNSVLIVEVESGKNEVPAVIEEAAMLFANGQPQDALDKLDKAIDGGKLESWSLPAWLMRFDVYQDLGRKSEFEEKALDFIVKFERSPPAWTDLPEAAGRTGSSANVTLSGPLSAASATAFTQLRKAAEKQSKLRIDLGKLDSIDAAGCSLLLDTLKHLRAAKKEVFISGEAVALDLLRAHTVPGHAKVEQCFWLLVLDLYQQLGMLEEFEEAAVDYAVTYEVSPPSWEARPRVQPPPPPKPEASGARDPSDDSFRLEGEIAGQQDALMQALTAYTAKASPVLIDFSRARRIDYVNAGRLSGIVDKAVESGKAVVLRSAGEMTIALFAVVGLHQRARIIPRK